MSAYPFDDWCADHPLEALRHYPNLMTCYRVDACALVEPAAALMYAAHRLTPERRAWCEAAAGELRFFPDRLEPERREACRRSPA